MIIKMIEGNIQYRYCTDLKEISVHFRDQRQYWQTSKSFKVAKERIFEITKNVCGASKEIRRLAGEIHK